jgi:preprotein translocase subunit YajC
MGKRLIGAVGALLALCAPAALADDSTAATGGLTDFLPLIILIVVFGGIFYFMLIRPQRRRQQQMTTLIEGLKRGDTIVTAGGIHGEIDSIGDTSVVMTLEDGSKLRMAKTSIVRKLDK